MIAVDRFFLRLRGRDKYADASHGGPELPRHEEHSGDRAASTHEIVHDQHPARRVEQSRAEVHRPHVAVAGGEVDSHGRTVAGPVSITADGKRDPHGVCGEKKRRECPSPRSS